MGIIVRKVSRGIQYKEPGHYVRLSDNSEWKITDITFTTSGNVVLHLQDLKTFARELKTICHIADLVELIGDGATHIEY
jgi:hypothetical protein